jgi:eukaryotic-like serine/threonine-protein kinase
MARQGRNAAAEFQKILDHPGTVLSESIGALARLNIARAYALEGEMAKARSSYQEFLTLWQNADADIPVLKQAKIEFTKLQYPRSVPEENTPADTRPHVATFRP